MKHLMSILPAVLLVFACGSSSVDSIRIALSVWPGYELFHLARTQGLLDSNLAIEWVDFLDLGDSRRAFELGQVNALCCTNVELLLLADQGYDLTVCYVLDTSLGADVILCDSLFTTNEAIEDARYGVESNAVGQLLLGLFSAQQGFRKDLTVYQGDQIRLREAYLEGSIDALVTYPPYSVELMARRPSRLLFDSSSEPNMVLDLLVLRSDVLQSRMKDLQAVLQAYNGALSMQKRNPSLSDSVMARRENISVDEFRRSLDQIELHSLSEQEALMSDEVLGETLRNTCLALKLNPATLERIHALNQELSYP